MSEDIRLSAVLSDARRRFAEAGLETPDLDARILVADALGLDRAALFLREREPVDAATRALVDARIERRLAGEPVYRILGRRSFFDHEFRLSPATLEPRPDTEALVELCRAPIAERIEREGRCVLVDVGTGTGAIAVSLLALFPEAHAIATDISAEALETAAMNAREAGVGERFRPVLCDHLAGVEEPVGLIVSNPPYIPTAEIAALSREVRDHDPILALDGGADGLQSYRRIAKDSGRVLATDGEIALEIGAGQGADVENIFAAQGFELIRRASDLGGVERALLFRPVLGSAAANAPKSRDT
ncbi:peptide chain release factor N(5)-glutamine methyltransferase [Aureimonas psammosilenae]|uniref:peptide chain release factor N(5)-glutamine methyltransferase n=1 Tax=Aureimonas psammosilenae TaxID=2495496 RepID=UPI001F21B4E6|nr:peptide chain release factor N(5)-glutamine methyltransferase [Aureimonas psammosilenae]